MLHQTGTMRAKNGARIRIEADGMLSESFDRLIEEVENILAGLGLELIDPREPAAVPQSGGEPSGDGGGEPTNGSAE